MDTRWIDSDSDHEAEARANDFWSAMREDLDSGQFWADRIKEYRGDPAKWLSTAIENQPLPAAFNEAAIATRVLIREKRKAGDSYEEELTLLYWLAAVRSFMLDYSERLKEPGFNVIEAIPGKKLRSLPFSYNELGYRNLTLLNKTDCKWFVESWGEPASHTTLNELHRGIWDEYEGKLLSKRKVRDKQFEDEWRSLSAKISSPGRTKSHSSQSGCAVVLITVLVAVVWVAVCLVG